MSLADIQNQIFNLSREMTLSLDAPQSVKLQVKQINLIIKKLKALKKELNLSITQINQQAAQSTPDSLVSVGLDLFGKRKLAGQVRASTRKAIQAEKLSLRQPYIETKETIDRIILEAEQLKLQAQEYLLHHSA
ncbi:hypothetical protein H6G20_09085 [Desertifilum sp. FACHB-1129]|uniref:Uncharacterized protein n=2 Tax=Desertifilum tharense IPPAS B-1220 TaxID=1781255 RepID=A0A1E5QQ67_9CYAN|nr:MULTISPECIES: hypothetical protein [Desertifilum]MDA0209156.1 hypothetical protein [Cyanobacteria bacterium FC1]MBD2311810.1 hypothetical protein [Desertifilum sp. FACHB-1129]MBD2322954.1 hypothetical protein [Desertifilum sp. FACHB-866]MBD2333385.1 hypothetical protein [Desertifilum sp. FACHB-868]OEJ76798.1 hypothetical protein BH720_02135 [Desertifilum tharense IPPAS B-1220]